MHEILHRPPTRLKRRAVSLRLDDRLLEWEFRHPVLAHLLGILIIGGGLLFVMYAWWLVR